MNRPYARWTKDIIIKELRTLNSRGTKMSPRGLYGAKQSALYAACLRHFGSFDSAVKAAGLERNRYWRQEYDAEGVLAEIREMHRRGEDLSSGVAYREHGGLWGAGRRVYGSWDRALAEAGVDPSKVRRKRRLDGEIIADRLLEMMDAGATLDSMKRDISIYVAAPRYFGSLENAVKYAMEHRQEGVPSLGVPVPNRRGRRGKVWTEEEILDGLRSVRDQGMELKVKNVPGPLYRAARKHFGSFRAAVQAMGDRERMVRETGPERVTLQRRWSKELVAAEVLKLQEAGADLRYKTVEASDPALFKAAGRYFGSWGGALEAAGVREIAPSKKKKKRGKTSEWSREAVLKELTALRAGGAKLSSKNIRKRSESLYFACTRHYGSVPDAIRAAGE